MHEIEGQRIVTDSLLFDAQRFYFHQIGGRAILLRRLQQEFLNWLDLLPKYKLLYSDVHQAADAVFEQFRIFME